MAALNGAVGGDALPAVVAAPRAAVSDGAASCAAGDLGLSGPAALAAASAAALLATAHNACAEASVPPRQATASEATAAAQAAAAAAMASGQPLEAPPPGITSNTATAQWRVFTDVGRELVHQGRHTEAESFFLRALEAARAGFGPEDAHVASACNNLAEFYRLRRQFDKAEPLYREVGCKRSAGPAWMLLQATAGRVARRWRAAAAPGGSRFLRSAAAPRAAPSTPPYSPTPLPRRLPQALRILTLEYGPRDARVAFSLHNLGGFYLSQRRLDQASEMFEQVGRWAAAAGRAKQAQSSGSSWRRPARPRPAWRLPAATAEQRVPTRHGTACD